MLFPIGAIASNATIFYLKGEVEVVAVDQSVRKAEKSMSVARGETVRTGSNGLAVLEVEKTKNSNIKVKLDKQSSVKVGADSQNKIAASNDVFLELGGAFVNVVKRKLRSGESDKDEKREFKLHTKTASMGVRGTQFFAAVTEADANNSDLWMCVNEGVVEVNNKNAKSQTLVKKGEGIAIRKGGATSAPKPLAWTSKLNWQMNPKSGELDNKVSIKEAYYDILNIEYE